MRPMCTSCGRPPDYCNDVDSPPTFECGCRSVGARSDWPDEWVPQEVEA